ncbi:MAG TPA: aminotransferase class V-fold PLP-dependent enzyme [Vicinamibacterales bacterium]|nr:aminotransferase class V-fold PLP-dependent enzyme [Vicinamibacterales bacterium]
MPDAAADSLQRWRDEFPILSRSTYLISNSLGAMPRGVARSLADYAEAWSTRGVRAWEDRWWEMALEVGNRVAGLLGAPAGTVSMHDNVTTAQMIALSALRPAGRRRKIVCAAADFPSMIRLYRALGGFGFDLDVVPSEPDLNVREERLVEAIDEDTLAVAFSHVLFRTSYLVDPRPIVERAKQVGAVTILDVYQSAGIVPVDLTVLDVDFATGGCLKWLCGGPGNGFLYTRPELLRTVEPRYTGWLALANPFEFDIEDRALREDAMRMMNGTPPVPAFYAAIPGLEIVSGVGVNAIREKSVRMTAYLLSLLDERGWRTPTSRNPDRVAGTVAIDLPEALPASRALKAREVLVDYRPKVGIRVSPHFYNTAAEVDHLVAELADIVATRAYGSPGASRVT